VMYRHREIGVQLNNSTTSLGTTPADTNTSANSCFQYKQLLPFKGVKCGNARGDCASTPVSQVLSKRVLSI
jgi:hypothetical protein